MKILMSAFACGPGSGSEAGVGWNMALETARLGHEVVVLTQTEFQEDIERELAAGTLPANLRFDIFTPDWLEWIRDTGLRWGFPLTWYLVSVLWQFCALFHARGRYKQADFDLIHHVSFASIRHTTLLTRLGLPTVIGPLGGGETAPMALRKTFPFRYWCAELLRDAHNCALRADPISRLAFRDAKLILLRTEESLVAVPCLYRNKVHINVGLGIEETTDTKPIPRKSGESFRLLYAGRILWWKGVHLALRALARARAQNVDATLTIVGGGPARRDLEKLARKLGISDHVIWRGEVSRQELLGMYGAFHAFLFPSLHDAGGLVILEAWVHGLPVICLDLGGPGKMVDTTCGRVVPVANCSEDECVARIASEIIALATNERRRLTLCRGAIRRCRELSWSKIVAALYTEIVNRLCAMDLEHDMFAEPGSSAGRFPDGSASSL
jgi:glycosyltransferase involved in cell wall biosynthesis